MGLWCGWDLEAACMYSGLRLSLKADCSSSSSALDEGGDSVGTGWAGMGGLCCKLRGGGREKGDGSVSEGTGAV